MMKNKKPFRIKYIFSFLFVFVFAISSYAFSFGTTYFLKSDSDKLAYLIDEYTKKNSCDFVHFSFENENKDSVPASNAFFRKTFNIDTSSGSLNNSVYAYTETNISDASINYNGTNQKIALSMAASDIGHCFDFSFVNIVSSSTFHKVTFSKKLLYGLMNKDLEEPLSSNEIESLQNTIFTIAYDNQKYECVCYAVVEKSKNRYFDHFLDSNFVIFHESEIQLDYFSYELITVAGHERLSQLFTVFSNSGHKLESLNFYTYLNNIKDTSVYTSCFQELYSRKDLKPYCILLIVFSCLSIIGLCVLYSFKKQLFYSLPVFIVSLICIEIVKNLIIRFAAPSLIIFCFLSPVYVLPIIVFGVLLFLSHRRQTNE